MFLFIKYINKNALTIMSEPATMNTAQHIIASLLHLEENPHSSYRNNHVENRLMEYERKTNVYVYIDDYDHEYINQMP